MIRSNIRFILMNNIMETKQTVRLIGMIAHINSRHVGQSIEVHMQFIFSVCCCKCASYLLYHKSLVKTFNSHFC